MACKCGKKNGRAAVIEQAVAETMNLTLMAGLGTAYGPVTGVRYPFTNGRQFVDTRDVEELRKRGYLLA